MQLTVALLLVLAFVGASAQQARSFSADATVSGDPSVKGGYSMRVDYSLLLNQAKYTYSQGLVEILDIQNQYRLVGGTTGTCCERLLEKGPLPQFVLGSNPPAGQASAVRLGSQACSLYAYSRPSNNPTEWVSQLWAVPSTGYPCQAKFNNGKTFVFENVENLDAGVSFAQPSDWKCPPIKCNQPVDVVFLLDKSGSISNSSWTATQNFVTGFANAFDWGNGQSRMGLVAFYTYSVNITRKDPTKPETGALETNKDNFLTYANKDRGESGYTCVGCGFLDATRMLNRDPIAGRPRLIVMLSDGRVNIPANVQSQCAGNWASNDKCDVQPSCDGICPSGRTNGLPRADEMANSAKNQGITIISVGVGEKDGDLRPAFLSRWSSEGSYLPVGTYDGLLTKLNNITTTLCPASSSRTCNCKGLCGCGGKCLCPDICSSASCTDSQCVDGKAGCTDPTPRDCKAFTDSCNTGVCDKTSDKCKAVPINCDAGGKCRTGGCIPGVGCAPVVSNITSCPNYSPCTTCDETNGCQNPACNANCVATCTPKPCKINKCVGVNNADCVYEDVDCGTNGCQDRKCNEATNKCESLAKPDSFCDDKNFCTSDRCDSSKDAGKGGCENVPVLVEVLCNDYDNCTVDTCDKDKGCVATPITCPPDANDLCTNTTCDSVFGCQTGPTDCYAQNATLAALKGPCHVFFCNDTTGVCVLGVTEGEEQDECGVCKKDTSKQGLFCKLSPAAIAGIGAAGIAGIAIGAAAAAALLGFGGKKGHDFLKQRAAARAAVQDNPLYQGNAQGGNNALFEGR